MQNGDQERPQPTFIPTISEQTRQTLVSRLGLDTDAVRANLLLSRKNINPVEALNNLTESVFEGVAIHNPHFVRTILSTLNELYGHKTSSYLDIDASTKGIALVLEAYQLETNQGLFALLSQLRDEDLTQGKGIIRDTLAQPVDATIPILERILNAPKIPEHQVNLNYCLNQAMGQGSFARQSVQGGVAMYRVLSHLWPKLSPAIPPVPPS